MIRSSGVWYKMIRSREKRRNSFDQLVKIYLPYLFIFYGLFPCETEPWTRVKDVDDLVRAISMLVNQLKINVLLIADQGVISRCGIEQCCFKSQAKYLKLMLGELLCYSPICLEWKSIGFQSNSILTCPWRERGGQTSLWTGIFLFIVFSMLYGDCLEG